MTEHPIGEQLLEEIRGLQAECVDYRERIARLQTRTAAEQARLEAENAQLRAQVAALSKDESLRLVRIYRDSHYHKRCTVRNENPYADHRCACCKQADVLITARLAAAQKT